MSVSLTTTQVSDSDAEMVEIFTIDGRSYLVPKRQRMNLGVKFLRMMRKSGPMEAQAYLLEEVLGEENLDALEAVEDLTQEQFNQIVQAAVVLVLGAPENAPVNQGKP